MGIWTFMSMSPKLSWVNDAVALVTLEGDPQWDGIYGDGVGMEVVDT
jgi:hypothetical protein